MIDSFAADTGLASNLRPSPNHDARPHGQGVTILLLHYTGMDTAEAALARLTDPAAKVSAHYVVDENGAIVQLVPEARRAWHAGTGMWGGRGDINACSIGIEIANPGHDGGYPPFPPVQIDAVIALGLDILSRHPIKPDHVLAHSDTAPSRKQDPGELFPWKTLAEAGLGLWVPPAPISGGRFLARGDRGEPVEALQAMLALYGYGIGIDGQYDDRTAEVVTAFQRHFRPDRIDGVADASTVTTLRDLLAQMPR